MQNISQTRRVLRFAAFQVDLSSGELQKHGTKIRLQEQPFQILAMLLERPGEVITREELRQKLWPSDTFVDFDVGLNSAIVRLRAALGDSAEKPRFVETLPRRGYRFIAAVHNGDPAAHVSVALNSTLPAPAEAAAQTGEFTSAARRPSLILWIPITAFVVVLGLSLGFNVHDVRNRLLGKPGLPQIHSIAVLPLENLSGDPAQEFFADGMTDALITDLAQVGSLRVISRTSVMQYKGAHKLLPQIAAELNVDAVVEGTVTKSENRVRITAQLIEARSDRHLWAASYERELASILTLQDDVARGIATEIQAKLTPEEQARLAKTRPVNPAAYEAYLRGRLLWSKWSVEEANKALQYFQQARALDPSYAQAYSGVSDCYRILALLGGMPQGEAWEKAKAAATRALELDGTLAEAHRSLAPILLNYDWDWAASERENQRALQLNPGDAETYRVYGHFLRVTGRLNEAIAMIKRAQELDPLSLDIGADLGATYYFARRYDEAIKQCQKVLELDPSFALAHLSLGRAYEAERKFPEAIVEFKLSMELSPRNDGYLGNLARVYAVAGKTAEARQILAHLKEQSKIRYVAPLQFALIYAALGERDRAFVWLEKAFEERNNALLTLSFAPWFDPLRSDPRFADLVRRVGLAVKRADNSADNVSK